MIVARAAHRPGKVRMSSFAGGIRDAETRPVIGCGASARPADMLMNANWADKPYTRIIYA
jgi:hypothetical protein